MMKQSWMLSVVCAQAVLGLAQVRAVETPLPDVRMLMSDVQAHQRKLDAVRESYTYTARRTVQDVDGNGRVTKTEQAEFETFFVNGHLIERQMKKDNKPLDAHDEQKETERVTKLVEKAEKTPRGQTLDGQTISIGRLLEIMDVRNERRIAYRGRPTIVFDFVGRKDAKTHGVLEDASKKIEGTLWVDETDRQVAHLEARFVDNFHVVGGVFANVQKGSYFKFDQGPLDEGLWLPTGGEGSVQVRVLLVKNVRQRFIEYDGDFKRFRVETQQHESKTAATPK